MRLLILSDLHLEVWGKHTPVQGLLEPLPDIVILAGDIHTGAKAVAWANSVFSGMPVLYAHGNHEAYGSKLESIDKEIRAACIKADNVHFLNCEEYRQDNVRFLGATLWTDFKLFGDDTRQAAMRDAEAVMLDYKRIRLASKGYSKLRASDTAQFHSRQKSWLKAKLAEPFNGRTVVVSHMAPSMRSVAASYATDLVSAAYASDLDEIAEQADLWVHGHMHDSFDYQIGKCRVVCNPCGYRMRDGTPENERFNPHLIVELT